MVVMAAESSALCCGGGTSGRRLNGPGSGSYLVGAYPARSAAAREPPSPRVVRRSIRGLAAPAGTALNGYGIPTLAGPFLFSAMLFGLSTLLLLLLLRPDPAVVARGLAENPALPGAETRRSGLCAALPIILSPGPARLGVGAMTAGHVVMVGVMTMTPVHVRSAGHDAAHTLRIVGLILSAHVAGMFAFSPVFGWLADRLGRRPVIVAGIVLLLAACAVAGRVGQHPAGLSAGLMLLGLGWSATTVAGATLLSEAVPAKLRPSAQGLSDLTMGLAGASAGALSGVIVEAWGYSTLTLLAALAAVPLIALLRRERRAAEILVP